MTEYIMQVPVNEDDLTESEKEWFDRYGAVRLIRCKDCKWWDKKGESPYGYCHACKHGYSSPNWEIGIYRTYKGDWFCADGERASYDQVTEPLKNKDS